MTSNKALKADIRERMQKTGERYTAARRVVLGEHRSPSLPILDSTADASPAAAETDAQVEAALPVSATVPVDAAGDPAMPPRVAEPGVSDEAVRRATGKSWDEWLAILDAWGATDECHRALARHVQEEHGLDGWWAQSITVGYERMRGRRTLHEQSDGFAVSVSKTFPVPVERLYAAFADDARRDQWLEPRTLRPRSQSAPKTARFDVVADGSRVVAYLTAKGEAKASVALQHERLASAAQVEPWRAFWKERLARLATLLASETAL